MTNEEEHHLLCTRWQASVYVGLADWYEPVDQRVLINFEQAHLVGRRALLQVRGAREGPLVGFTAGMNSLAMHQSVERFALSFADESVFGANALAEDVQAPSGGLTSSYDHLLPEHMRPTD